MKKSEIDNCIEYKTFKDVAFIIDTEKKFWINGVEINDGYFSISGNFGDSIVLFEENKFETFVYDYKGKLKRKIENYALVMKHKFSNGNYLAVTNDGESITWNLYDLEHFKIIQQYGVLGFNGVYLVIDERSFISKNKKKISLFNFENEIIWELFFSELLQDETATLNSEVIKINNKLYFVALGAESGGLFCLDVNSGKVLIHYPSVSRFLVKDENYIYSSKYENILCKINPITNEIEEWDANQLVNDNGFENIHDHRCTADNGLVYFTQTLGDNKAKFGILDTNKKELVYKYDFEPKNRGIGSIQVSNDRIYISTQDNTLHIFEKDK